MIDYARDRLNKAEGAQSAGDLHGAAENFLAAARFGVPSAMESFIAVLRQIEAQADAGDADMRATFGEMALESNCNIPEAIRNLKRAAALGNVRAKRVLGHALVNGIGVDRDPSRAAGLFREAADAGDHYGQFNLSMLYISGNGVPRDEDLSMRLLRLAADGRLPVAMAVLGDRLGALGRDDEALAWYLRAAEAGLYQAMHTAACWYRDGFGTDPDNVQALRWFLEMQNVGRKDSMHEALALSRVMSDREVREAARLAQREPDGEILVQMKSNHSSWLARGSRFSDWV